VINNGSTLICLESLTKYLYIRINLPEEKLLMSSKYSLISALSGLLFSMQALFAQAPVAQFNSLPSQGCAPLTVQFYNSSSASGTYSWNFGDPGSGINNLSSACSPIHTFQQAGTYTVTLTVNTLTGPVTTTQTVTVHPSPNPVISGQDTLCMGQTISYSVTPAAGNTYLWSAIGGTVVGAANNNTVQVYWNNSGGGQVTVSQTNAFGCKKTVSKAVMVIPPPVLGEFCGKKRREGSTGGQPSNDQLSDQDCVCAWDLDTFALPNASSWYTYTWTISGGTLVAGQGSPNPVFQWGAGPTATITVIASSPFGCSDTATCVVDICTGPRASFTGNNVCLGSTTNFNASASTVAANILQYSWDFGDFSQQVTTGPFVSHTYAATGTYTVRLIVSYGGGCVDDTTIQVTVSPGEAPPIECPGTVCHHTKHCYGTPYFPGATYNWTVTGGTFTVQAPGDSICVIWGNGPIGTISLTVTGGPYTCASNTVNIPIFPSTIVISGPDTICVGTRSFFTAPHIPGTCYSWTVNGNPRNPVNSSGNMIAINPAVPGVYTIAVSMTNELICCSGTATRSVVVQGRFSILGSGSVCPGTTHTYNISPAHPVNWQVSGGTVISSGPSSITIQWGNGPSGSVTASTTQPANFCDDRIRANVTINPAPPNPAIVGPLLVCKGSTAQYTYQPLPAITGSTWGITPATGVVTTLISPNKYQVKFNTVGNYTIQVQYANFFGCNSNSQLSVQVLDTALPNITGNTNVCIGNTETYSIPSNPGGVYTWSVIGGTILSGIGTNTITVQWGNINQGQVMIQNSLCGGLKIRKVKVNPFPGGPVTFKDTTCAGTSIKLVAPPGFTYQWSTGQTSQIITITSPGNYWVILNNGTCKDTSFINASPIPKHPKPQVTIAATPLASPYCPTQVQMTATFNANWTYAWTPTGSTTHQAFSNVNGSTHTVVVTNQFGCKDTAQVTINTNCVNPPGSCRHNSTLSINYNQCTGQFTSSGSNIAALYWNFGDGTYSNLMNPVKYYSSLGVKTILVDVLDVNGCWSAVPYSFNITVNSILKPKIKHSFNTPCNYTLATFSQAPGSVLLSNSAISHFWNFGAPAWTSTSPTANFNYSVADTFYTYNVVSDAWCRDTTRDTVIVKPFRAQFFSCGGCSGQPVQLVDLSNSFYPIISWNWNFGDGFTSALQSPFHIYASTGTYTVTLTIVNSQGCTATVTQNITIGVFNAGTLSFIKNGVPYPFSGQPIPICPNDKLVALAPFGSGWTYAWNNGVSSQSDTISQSGQYFVIISNGNNCTDTLGPFTVILNPKPVAVILGDTAACAFTSLQALPGVSDTAYTWTTAPPSFTGTGVFYSVFNTGNNMVQLIVQNQWGCLDTAYQNVNILPAPTVSVMPFSPPPLCQRDTVHLNAFGSPPGGTYSWNTGQNGPSIVAGYNMYYQVTYTAPNGCPSPGGAFVVVNPRPDLSIVPSGCYEVCNKNKSVQVCGPGKSLADSITVYNWYRNGVLFATTQHITITQNGTYWLWAQNNFGCTEMSDSFHVTFVNPPGANIGGPVKPLLCKGKNQHVPLDAEDPADNVIYTWYLNEEPVFTGPQFVVTQPGTYILNAYFSECCQAWDTAVVTEGDCCWDTTVVYTTIQDSTVINTDQVWNGKYYVAGKVYVRDTAVLDLTGVDVVFSRTGEIIFEDSTIIRANNSVFRPCDMHDIWVGFTFKDSSQGLIHTSLFKNATTAIDVRNTAPYSVRITDDVFSDCYTGIHIQRKGNYTEGITHNSFVIENSKLPYTGTTYFGIKLANVNMEELVSQNIFRNSDKTNQGNTYHGVHAVNSGAVLSSNRFSNMFRSIDVSSNQNRVTLENNFIELTENGIYPNDYQVRVTNCKLPVVLHHNSFRHSAPTMNNSVAVFLADNVNSWVHNNDFQGYRDGIQAFSCQGLWVNENKLDLVNRIGIFLNKCTSSHVRCNTVRAKSYSNTPVGQYPVGIRTVNCNSTLTVYTNCVLDTRTAMWFSAPTGTPVPEIRNNFLYNYRYAGMFIQGHNGSVGSAVQPGQNTFSSNNAGNATPDFRVVPGFISQGGNFGVLVLAGSVSTWNPNLTYNSTAACGLQIANAKYTKLNQYNVCESFKDQADPVVLNDLGIGIDKVQLGGLVWDEFVPREGRGGLISLALALAELGEESSLEKLIAYNQPKGNISPFEASWFRVKLAMRRNDLNRAENLLHTMRAEDREGSNLLAVLQAELAQARGRLTEADLFALREADDSTSAFGPVARDLLQSLVGGHDYLFPGVPESVPVPETGPIYTEEPRITVMPNPVSDKVAIDFNMPVTSNVEVELVSAIGGVQKKVRCEWQQGRLWVDLQGWSAGMYLVRVRVPDSRLALTAKLIKL
jgi:PKD repeat protein